MRSVPKPCITCTGRLFEHLPQDFKAEDDSPVPTPIAVSRTIMHRTAPKRRLDLRSRLFLSASTRLVISATVYRRRSRSRHSAYTGHSTPTTLCERKGGNIPTSVVAGQQHTPDTNTYVPTRNLARPHNKADYDCYTTSTHHEVPSKQASLLTRLAPRGKRDRHCRIGACIPDKNTGTTIFRTLKIFDYCKSKGAKQSFTYRQFARPIAPTRERQFPASCPSFAPLIVQLLHTFSLSGCWSLFFRDLSAA